MTNRRLFVLGSCFCTASLAQAEEGLAPEVSAPEPTAVSAPVAGTVVAPTIVASAEPAKKDTTGFGLSVTLDHAVGTGTFIEHPELRRRSDSVTQSWNLTPSYKFKVLGHTLSASARFLVDLDLTTPDNATGRRINPNDTTLRLSDGKLLEFGGVKVSVAASLGVPTSYESLNAKRQLGSLGASLGVSREFGDLSVKYTLGSTKYFHSTLVPTVSTDVVRSSDVIYSAAGRGEPAQLASGYSSISFGVTNSFDVSYQLTEQLSLGYSVLIWNRFKYNLHPERDEFTSEFADVGRERAADLLWPTLSLSYELSDAVKDALALPFSLSLDTGITALHPAQSANNQDILWPVFYPAFAENRAANNYGSVFFDVTATF